MASIFEYKKTVRQTRAQLVEDQFKSGMQYTDAPLAEGLAKSLINYDIFQDGISLKPRPGLRTVKAYTAAAANDCLGTEQIVAARDQHVGDASYAQFLLKHSLAAGKSRLRTGQLRMLTSTGAAPAEGFTGIETEEYSAVTYASTNFVVPENAEIHGVSLSNTEVLARHIGTFGWNRQYYFFDPTNKKVVHTEWDTATSAFKFVADSPKTISSKDAVTWGYNMLSDTPYTFSNTLGAGALVFSGMLPYDENDALCLTPVINQSLHFEAFYTAQAGDKYTFVWEWRSARGDTWATLKAETITFADPAVDLLCTFSPPEDEIIIRVAAYGYTGDVQNDDATAVLAVGFSFDKADYGSTANIAPKEYDLINASGMTFWQNRLIIWGVPEDPTILFASDINDPTYFPYPNNCDTFDEPIKYALPLLNKLLVFTSTKLYMLSLSSDGMSWATDCIQNNLHISDWDCHLIQVVKNMLFFRSGNYYYMVVPKANSVTGELTLAPVSKTNYYFFDHFKDNIDVLVKEVYGHAVPLTLVHYYNYLDFEDVHNVYVFQTSTDEYFNVCALYNSVSRSWRLYIYGSQGVVTPYKADATQRGTLCSMASLVSGEITVAVPQLLKFNVLNNADYYIPRGATLTTVDALLAEKHWVKNWQYIDTGFREHNSNVKKRYREAQFVINNISQRALQFYTDFIVDGELREGRYETVVTQDLDPESSNYGLITVEQVLSNPLITPSATTLGTDENDTAAWVLDESVFPDVAFWKARLPVSGKGYVPRLKILSRNENEYELLNISWVYREMNSR